MSEKEIQYLKGTVMDGSKNQSNSTWQKAFKISYPNLGMDRDTNYFKVLCKVTTSDENIKPN